VFILFGLKSVKNVLSANNRRFRLNAKCKIFKFDGKGFIGWENISLKKVEQESVV